MSPDAVEIRAERPDDAAAITAVNDEAFGGTAESRLVESIRRSGCPTISLVAVSSGLIVGHIFFSPIALESHPSIAGIGLAPMAVLPAFQRQGIGSRLVEAGLQAGRNAGYELAVVLGHVDFYPRFGFRAARELGLTSIYTEAGDASMALELRPGALAGRAGLVTYRPEFADV
jgi:putative acetyltransferase